VRSDDGGHRILPSRMVPDKAFRVKRGLKKEDENYTCILITNKIE